MANRIEYQAQIVWIDPNELVPYQNNTVKHSDERVDELASQIACFGFDQPIVADKNKVIIKGHRRRAAALKLKMKSVPAVIREDLDIYEVMAARMADNKMGEGREWDEDKVRIELGTLKKANFELKKTGFGEGELKKIDFEGNDQHNNKNEDEVPTTPKEAKSKRGEIYLLGNHRLMCGDSTSKEDVEKLMNGEKADMVFTDPPYGMNLDTDYSKMPSTKAEGNKTYRKIIGDSEEFDPTPLLETFSECDEIILFGADYYSKKLPLGGWYVWDKRVTENFDAMIGSAFELAWSKAKHKREIARFNNTLFSGEAEARNKVHPTQKPVSMILWFFERLKGNVVVDLFLGSGSTLIACEKTNRRCFGMEIDPIYVDVIIQRWEEFTGKKAQLSD